MNIGQKISLLKDRMGFKNYSEFGKAIGLPGDWLLELSKKDCIQTVDITRLLRIADYFNITLDELLRDSEGNYLVESRQKRSEYDIGDMLDTVQSKLKEEGAEYYGVAMKEEVTGLAIDSIDVVKQLIKQNLYRVGF